MNLLEHATPFPVKPDLHWQTKLPKLLMHKAFVSQLSVSVSHSSMSIRGENMRNWIQLKNYLISDTIIWTFPFKIIISPSASYAILNCQKRSFSILSYNSCGGITKEQNNDIERIQKRALKIIYSESRLRPSYKPGKP